MATSCLPAGRRAVHHTDREPFHRLALAGMQFTETPLSGAFTIALTSITVARLAAVHATATSQSTALSI
jgi:hypothetical protein